MLGMGEILGLRIPMITREWLGNFVSERRRSTGRASESHEAEYGGRPGRPHRTISVATIARMEAYAHEIDSDGMD